MLDLSRRWQYFWLVFTLALVVLLALVVHTFIGTMVFGIFLYYSSRPIYDRLRSRVRPASVAALTALLVLILPVTLLFGYITMLALGEIEAIADIDLSAYEELLSPYVTFAGSTGDLGSLFESLLSNPRQLLEDGGLQGRLMDAVIAAGGFIVTFLTSLFHLFIALTVAFYLLKDDDRLVKWVRDNFDDQTLDEYGRAVDADLQTVFFGNILNALLTAVIGTVVFSVLGMVAPAEVPVPVPILLGLLTGLTSLVPVIGMRIVTVPVTLYLTVLAATTDPQLLWFPVLFFAVSLVFVESIPDLVLRPYISGRNLHMGLVMFAYIFGPLMFGWYGIFLGPLLLVVLVHFAQIVIPVLVRSTATNSLPPSPQTPPDDPGRTHRLETDDHSSPSQTRDRKFRSDIGTEQEVNQPRDSTESNGVE